MAVSEVSGGVSRRRPTPARRPRARRPGARAPPAARRAGRRVGVHERHHVAHARRARVEPTPAHAVAVRRRHRLLVAQRAHDQHVQGLGPRGCRRAEPWRARQRRCHSFAPEQHPRTQGRVEHLLVDASHQLHRGNLLLLLPILAERLGQAERDRLLRGLLEDVPETPRLLRELVPQPAQWTAHRCASWKWGTEGHVVVWAFEKLCWDSRGLFGDVSRGTSCRPPCARTSDATMGALRDARANSSGSPAWRHDRPRPRRGARGVSRLARDVRARPADVRIARRPAAPPGMDARPGVFRRGRSGRGGPRPVAEHREGIHRALLPELLHARGRTSAQRETSGSGVVVAVPVPGGVGVLTNAHVVADQLSCRCAGTAAR